MLRKFTIGLLVFILMLSIVYGYFVLKYGDIDISGTLCTAYYDIDGSQDQLIETPYFKIRTPDHWIHIFSGHGVEGDPYGVFLTNKGAISYEYGFFAADYDTDDAIYQYTVEHKKIGGYNINIATDISGAIGITIPRQHEMKSHMTLYMDQSVTDNYEQIISRLSNWKFK